MDENNIINYIDLLIFPLFLVFIFLAVQVWLLWKDVDKNELKLRTIDSESFFKKGYVYLLFYSIFFMAHRIFEGVNLPNSDVYHAFFEMLAVLNLSLFAYHWYRVFKASAHKKALPKELAK